MKPKYIFSATVLPLFMGICAGLPHHQPGHEDNHSPAEADTTMTTPTEITTISPSTSGEDMGNPTDPPTLLDTQVIGEIAASDNTSSSTTVPPPEESLKGVVFGAGSYLHLHGASNPSIQLVPPPAPQVLSANNIPITLLSIAGNSGATTGSSKNANDIHVDFTRFRYHMETGKLEKIGNTTGVCPENMRFFAVPGNGKSGACDCDYYQCSRPLIYSPKKHQCYWAWSQGPCEKDEWFVFDKDLKKEGKCEKNPCPQSPDNTGSLQYYFKNQDNDTCHEAGTQGYCTDPDERLHIFPGEPIPKCRKYSLCFPLSVPQELQCVYGNKFYYEGNCY